MHEYEYLLLDEIAAIARASVDTVRRWIRSGQLPSVKPGRRRLVRRGDLDRFLARDTLAERRALSGSAAAPREGTGNG
ncbi:MAG TPA: helix-turn-helix domain-containing protein [Polyangiaceae bacterium]|jgi:excisionase family DNA binding protein|nr:helix-turn-helix domain-containing protein [Polyangiaceae bacterium]